MNGIKENGRFYHGKKFRPFRSSMAAVLAFLVVAFLFCEGVNLLSKKSYSEQEKSLEEAVWRSVSLCYTMEGYYPPNLDYLVEEYGLSYDAEHFYIAYQAIGANIMPDITIIKKN